MRWPWSKAKTETRAAEGYSALSMLARAEAITGRRGAAELTATVAACVSLWEAGLSRADVSGTDLLTPRVLALMGRSLALRGEFVALIGDRGLIPAADWDLSSLDGAARAYRLSLPDAGGGRTVTALAAEVVHVAIGADVRTPWQGVAPLRRASLTAELLATVEGALSEIYGNAPMGSQVVPLPEMARDDQERIAASFRGARGRVMMRESVTTTAAGGPAPMTDWRPSDLSPSIKDSMIIETWDRARDSICQVFGVDPAMIVAVASGPGLREAQRHLAAWVLSPIAGLIAQEMSEKTGAAVRLDVVRPLGAVDHGGRARAAAQLIGAMASAKSAGLTDAQVSEAFRFVDLQAISEE